MARGLQVSHSESDLHSAISPKFSGNQIYQKSTRSYIIDWESLGDAIPQALGYPTRTGAGVLSRYLPHQDPYLPYLVATGYDTLNIGAANLEEQEAGQGNSYKKARLDLQFEKPLYLLLEDAALESADTANYNGLGARWAPEIDRFVEYVEHPEGSYIVPPATSGMMGWSGPTTVDTTFDIGDQLNAPFPQAIATIIGEANISLKWRFLPDDALPLTAIYNNLGKINQTTFGSKANSRLIFNPWTMLFLGASFNRIILPTGEFGWDLEYLFKFSGNQHQWNYYLNPRATKPNFYQVSRIQISGFIGTTVYYDPGAAGTGPTASGTLNKLTYNVSNLNDLFVIA